MSLWFLCLDFFRCFMDVCKLQWLTTTSCNEKSYLLQSFYPVFSYRMFLNLCILFECKFGTRNQTRKHRTCFKLCNSEIVHRKMKISCQKLVVFLWTCCSVQYLKPSLDIYLCKQSVNNKMIRCNKIWQLRTKYCTLPNK